MLEKLIAGKLAQTLNAGEEEREVYEYGLSAIISTVVTTIVLLIIGAMIRSIPETLMYIIVFTILRSQCGGYHAPTRIMCIVISSVGLLLVLYVFSKIGWLHIMAVITLIGMAMLSPVDSPNKTIHKSKRLSFKIRSIVISIVFLCATIWWKEMRTIIITTMMWVVLLMLCQVIIRKKRD